MRADLKVTGSIHVSTHIYGSHGTTDLKDISKTYTDYVYGASDTNTYIDMGTSIADTISFFEGATEAVRITSSDHLHVRNNVVAYSSTISDKRLKENIQPIGGSLEAICNIEGVKFDWKYRDEKNQIGLIAQNVEQYIPEAVVELTAPFYSNDDGTEYKTIKYDAIIPHLIESIKTLKSEIDNLKTKLCMCGEG